MTPVNIGGVSEAFVEWEAEKQYTEDKYVRYSKPLIELLLHIQYRTKF